MPKRNQKEFRIEKVIKTKGDKLYVERRGYNNSFNGLIDKKKQGSIKRHVFIHQIFTRRTDSVKLKSDIDKLDIDKIKNVPSGSSSLKVKQMN